MEVFGKYLEDAFSWINNNQTLLFTVDFFTPIVDSPYDFGCISAANALSDIYAKGGEPKIALNILMFPFNKLDIQVLREIIKGGNDKLEEAKTILGGGHSIDDDNIKFGYAVCGIADKNVWKIDNVKENDDIYITKPLGTGIISQAVKLKKITNTQAWEAIESMKKLNKYAKDVMKNFQINACTDITGFGLLGHLLNMVINTQYTANIFFNKLPFFDGVEMIAKQNIFPGGTKKNLQTFDKEVEWTINLKEYQKIMCADAQTSGGLLFTATHDKKEDLLKKFKQNNLFVKCIGKIIPRQNKPIKVS